MSRLSHDVWHHILHYLDAQEDFWSLALVCKSIHPLAIARLYSTLILCPRRRGTLDMIQAWSGGHQKKSSSTQLKEFRAMVGRLAETPDGLQARSVREIEIFSFREMEKDIGSDLDQALARLAKVLPNLGHFRLRTSKPGFESLIHELNENSGRTQLHLLDEDGSRAVTGPMPGVTSMCAKVDPFHDTRDTPNRRMLDLQKLFFACPNLKSFSLLEWGNYGGCVIRIPQHQQFYRFELTGTETFPPLESLSLDGYRMDDEEWVHWRDNFNWSGLKSLSLGPQPNTHFLEYFKGHAKDLRSLTVQTYAEEGKTSCPTLKSFLRSFNTLERLTIGGHFVPVSARTNHPKLRELSLHAIELRRRGARPTLDAAALHELDVKFPELEILEIDINRNDQWPEDIIMVLASGFTNLRHLKLHCEVGIDWENGVSRFGGGPRSRDPLLPMLDEDLAKGFGQTFFTWRAKSRLETLTLQTGEQLRRFPQWAPAFSEDERRWSRTIHIKAPSNADGELVISTERAADLW